MAQDEKTGRSKITSDNITILRECIPKKYESIKKKETKLKKVLSFNSKNLTVINSLVARTGLADNGCHNPDHNFEDNQLDRLTHLKDKLREILGFVKSRIPDQHKNELQNGKLDMSKIFSYDVSS